MLNPPSSLNRTLFALISIVLLTVALRAPLLGIPFERDEGEYAYIAWRLDHHELPYRDWFDQKPTAIFWAYRIALALPFDAIRSVHFMALIFAVGSAVSLYFLARRLLDDAWGLAAALLFALLAADPLIQGTSANTELFMLLPMILGSLVYLQWRETQGGTKRRIFVSGALNGVAMMFKQVAATNWVFLVAVTPLLASAQRRTRDTATFISWSAAGVIAICALVAGYFAAHGALHDFIYNVYTHNLEYVRSIPFPERLTLSQRCPSTER